jgi:hypothetical protein
MRLHTPAPAIRAARALLLILFIQGCGGSYEESVTGVKVPIPNGMKKSRGKTVEISLPGFGGGQASFEGKLDPDKVFEFYKKEMPERGWSPSMSVLSRGGMLGYAKEGKTVLIAVGRSDDTTTLNVMVGGTAK